MSISKRRNKGDGAKPAAYDAWAEFYDFTNRGLPGEAEFYVGQAVRIGGDTLELGCGTGRLALPMAMSGVNVTGLDNSIPMLNVCREKRRAVGKTRGKLKLVHGDMTDFELGTRFDFIAMAYRTFMHLPTPDEQRRCLSAVRRHLAPDGVFILNVWAPKPSIIASLAGNRGGELRSAGRYVLPETGGAIVHFCATSCHEHRQSLNEEHVFHEVDGRGEVLRTEILGMERTWITPREMDNLVRLCGFGVEAVFGDFDCGPLTAKSDEQIWVLRGSEKL